MSAIGGATLKPAAWRNSVGKDKEPKTEAEAIDQFERGLDWSATKPGVCWGEYCSIRDFEEGDTATLRYGDRLMGAVYVRVGLENGNKRARKP